MRHLFVAFLLLLAPACGSSTDDGADPTPTPLDWTAELRAAVDVVIVPTYADLAGGAEALHAAVEALCCTAPACGTPSEALLAAAQAAWVAARSPWEQSEAFLFGPVSDLSLDPALDSWPVDRTQLDHVLDSEFELTADFISASLGGTLKGFHTLEYLLWGADHDQTAQALVAAPRECEYLVAVTEALALDAAALHAAWTDDGFGEAFALAGQPGGRYFAQADAVQQLLTGMMDICDEVANGKIADPFDEQNVNLVESQFSFNSLLDFADNMRSVQNLYTATYGATSGASLSAFVAARDPALDTRLRAEIAASISAITAIGEGGVVFRDAILDPARAPAIEAAQAAIRKVFDTLGGDVSALVLGR